MQPSYINRLTAFFGLLVELFENKSFLVDRCSVKYRDKHFNNWESMKLANKEMWSNPNPTIQDVNHRNRIRSTKGLILNANHHSTFPFTRLPISLLVNLFSFPVKHLPPIHHLFFNGLSTKGWSLTLHSHPKRLPIEKILFVQTSIFFLN